MYTGHVKPYSKKEAESFGDGFPDRGIKCKNCGTLIPPLENFGETQITEWREILNSEGSQRADDHLIALTGCNKRWAKIWRIHPYGPLQKKAKFAKNSKCPFCEKPLRMEKAKQCPHCFKSWRNE